MDIRSFFAPRQLPLLGPTESPKRKIDEQSPSPPPSPKRTERAQSFISVSSSDEDDGPPLQRLGEPSLCEEQKTLLDLIMSGQNIFFTGSAGCGKSTVLKAAVAALRNSGKRVYVTAPTGRAAIQVEGMTTWSYMGWHPNMQKEGADRFRQAPFASKLTKKRLRRTDVLVIDEISMVSSSFLDLVNQCLKLVRFQSREPFGGVQIILTGDFCQLPPVKPFEFCFHCGAPTRHNTIEDEFRCTNTSAPHCKGVFRFEDRWAFRSKAWEEAQLVHYNLSEIHRQSDETFIKMLQKCRLGIPFTEDDIDLLSTTNARLKTLHGYLAPRPRSSQLTRRNTTRLINLKGNIESTMAGLGMVVNITRMKSTVRGIMTEHLWHSKTILSTR